MFSFLEDDVFVISDSDEEVENERQMEPIAIDQEMIDIEEMPAFVFPHPNQNVPRGNTIFIETFLFEKRMRTLFCDHIIFLHNVK